MFSYLTNDHITQLASALDVVPGMRVLDLGSGSGSYLPAIFAELDGAGKVTAVDRSERALSDIREQYPEAIERGSLECKVADIAAHPLPFEDNFFDRILCQNVIECVADRMGLINECYRLLKPGGKFLMSHHDFDTAVYNSSEVELTRQLVHGFADTTQDWQDNSDGQIGRKLSGLMAASYFGGPEKRGTILIEEYEYSPRAYGYNYSKWATDIAMKTGELPIGDLRNWLRDLEIKASERNYYFSICLMAALGTKSR